MRQLSRTAIGIRVIKHVRYGTECGLRIQPCEDVTAAWTVLIPSKSASISEAQDNTHDFTEEQGAINLPITNEYNNNVYNIAVFHSLHCLVL